MEPFTKEDAAEVLDIIHHYQELCMEQCKIHFIHASDEWYLLAEQELPQEENYDGYLQLENGVGMLRLLKTEFAEALAEAGTLYRKETAKHKVFSVGGSTNHIKITIATGVLAAPTLRELASEFMEVFPQIEIQVMTIVNEFFGEQITVSGLLTGRDIIDQLKGKDLGIKLLLPCNLLRSGEKVFLDDVTLEEVENALQVKINIVKSSGQDLVSCLLQS